MNIASQKRKENIAEYLLYMWQTEDLIRAHGLDLDKIKASIIENRGLTSEQEHEMAEWYDSLIEMMRHEQVDKSGHLQINKNTLGSLAWLHRKLLENPKFEEYRAEFYRTLPYIVELRSKEGANPPGEIETCFVALYGALMLRLQRKPMNSDTEAAIGQIARFIALLAKYFHLEEADKIEIE